MPNVLIRDGPASDLEQIRAAAAEEGRSLQAYLLEAVHDRAAQLRRRAALSRIDEHLRGRPAVSDDDRAAVLDAIDDAHTARAEQLGTRPAR